MNILKTLSAVTLMGALTGVGGCVHERVVHDRPVIVHPREEVRVYRPAPVVVERGYDSHGYYAHRDYDHR